MSADPHDEALERWIGQRLGMRWDDSSRARLHSAVTARIRRLGDAGAQAYLERLQRREEAEAELRRLAQDLTIGETYFFRGRDHFEALRETALPDRMRARPDRALRLLSAGCASGEEAYSLAIAARELAPPPWRLEVIGLDLNGAFLDKARAGLYTPWSLRDVEAPVVQRHFVQQGRNYQLDASVRESVRFHAGNLMDPASWKFAGGFDIVFCRNVLIYFTGEAIQTVLTNLERAMAPGGYLFLGHSESLRGLTRDFHLCQTHRTFYYQLRAADGPPAARAFAAAEWDAAQAAPPPEPAPFDGESWMADMTRSAERISRLLARPARTAEPATPPAESSREAILDLFREERYAAAAELLSAGGPASVERRVWLAAARLQQGDTGAAERLCREALAADELNAEATYLLALCREQAGDLRGAIELARTAAYLDSGFAQPQVLLGRLARAGGDLEGARRAFDMAEVLFEMEEPARVVLFGGGFSREALRQFCRAFGRGGETRQ